MTTVRKPYQHFGYSAAKKEYLAGEMHELVAIGWVAASKAFIKSVKAKGEDNDVDSAAGRVVREVWKPLRLMLEEQMNALADDGLDAQADADLEAKEAAERAHDADQEDLGEDYDNMEDDDDAKT